MDQLVDLSAVGASGGTPWLLASGVPAGGRLIRWDQRGGLLASQAGNDGVVIETSRIDLATGTSHSLGACGSNVVIEGDWIVCQRSWVFFHDLAVDTGSDLFLGASGDLSYFQRMMEAGTSVEELAPTGVRRTVATDVDFAIFESPLLTGPRLLILADHVDPNEEATTSATKGVILLDPITGERHILVSGIERLTWWSPSPDGRRFVVATKTGSTFRADIFDLATVESFHIDLPALPPEKLSYVEYRGSWSPDSARLWLFDTDSRTPLVWDKESGVTILTNRQVYEAAAVPPSLDGGVVDPGEVVSPTSMFLDDRRHWLSGDPSGRVHVNDLQDPLELEGPALPFPGDGVASVDSDSHGGYVVLLAVSRDRYDLYWTDPSTGQARLLAARVGTDAFVHGQGRILVLSTGINDGDAADLTLYDLPSGRATKIGQNVVSFSVSPCAGCDVLEKGSRVAFAIRSPQPYAFDGIWVETLP